MPDQVEIVGTVMTGQGLSTDFMASFDYSPLGYDPVPGTLNVWVGKKMARLVQNLSGGIEIDEGFRTAVFHPMQLRDVHVHGRAYRRTVEIVAPIKLRDVLGLGDGDTVTLTTRIRPPGTAGTGYTSRTRRGFDLQPGR